jgi:cell division protein FtsL
MLKICIFAFVAYAAVLLINMQVNLAERKQQLNDLQIRHEVQRIANKELERQLEDGANQEYIERIAREKLDYVAPDERVYIDISGG